MCTHGHPTRSAPPVLGDWVEYTQQRRWDGSWHRLLVNRRDQVALRLSDSDAADLGLSGHTDATPPAELLNELHDSGFLATSEPTTRVASGWWAPLARFARTLDIRSTRSVGAVDRIYRHAGRYAFRRTAVAAQCILALAGLVAIVHAYGMGGAHLRLTAGQVPWAIGLSLAAIAVHELAHALVVVHHGRRIDAFGFRLHLGTPAFYVESVDALLLSRRHRIVQAFAGSWAEWMFTSAVALAHWMLPGAISGTLVTRFVIVNTITIASNLMPFVGLDGHFIAGDLLGEPDLAHSARGAVTRLAVARLSGRRSAPRDFALAAYSVVNAIVAAALLLMAGVFWYALFGGLIATAWQGPFIVRIALIVIIAMLLRPAAMAALPRVRVAAATSSELAARVRFRLQWRWRIAAVSALALSHPELRGLDDTALSEIAGRLTRARTPRAQRRADGTWTYSVPTSPTNA